jgi:fructosamine-3-kinase
MAVAGLPPAIVAAMEAVVGEKIVNGRAVSGGDINHACALTLSSGAEVFAKTNARSPAGMFAAEARGLAWLAEPKCLRVPRVLGHGEVGGVGFLLLEMIEPGRRVRDFDERLGRGLAALHRHGSPTFGLDHDNFIADLPQRNAAISGSESRETAWPEFYRARRLEPMLARAEARGLVKAGLRRRFDDLFARLPDLVGPPEPAARLHGDLWGGNLIVDDEGAPCLVDPAVYGGHREVDLAMMRLFGGFDARAFAAYDESHPLADAWQDRVPLYQLWPLLVHVALFGAGYLGSVDAALDRLL